MTTSSNALDLLKPWITWTLGDPAPDPEAQLDSLRAMLPGPLPDDYAAVLLALKQAVSLEHNEVVAVEQPPPPDPQYFTNVAPDPEFSILYGIGGGQSDSYTVPEVLDMFGKYMPKNLVPIGESTGDQICLDVSEAGNGRIYHWFLEGDPGPDVDGHRGWGNTFLLAHNFTDLCARLRQPMPAGT